ncbi:TOMM precursor leader peptide-binding protein [Streptacidiphilus anmyonensis]|uniref:TOMM precursor leader peptide-binding protein n=1 Tax=Streptacidiphilus anmyonensis TaxID=405782 RepID=UPI0005AAE92E|nr:TOMM precursor leader peptide-binding protein [Streptacidiphilus anmyonensis]
MAALLTTRYPAARTLPLDELDRTADGPADVLVVAMWRPSPGLCERADAFAHAHGLPWLPMVMERQAISVGPWVTPGSSPCHRCYRRRLVQHDSQWQISGAVLNAYTDDPKVGPAGFLPGHARTAAAVAGALIDHGQRSAGGPGGRVVTISLRGNTVSSDQVVGCHGCDRCDPALPFADLRSRLGLSEAVSVGAR